MLSIMIGMKLGPESNCFVQLNPEKRKYDKSFEEEKNYTPVRRSWKRLCRRILNQKMSTKFQTLLGRNDLDFCSCARTNWWRNPGQNINGSKLKSCTKPRKERNLKKEVEACQLSLNLSQNCSDYYLHLARGLFAIRNVQFNLFLFQLKDVIHLCQWWKSRRPIQNQKWSKMIYNCSEFCQEPPESSGRWECPALRRSVHVNPTMSTNYSWSPTMCYLSSNIKPTLQSCSDRGSNHTMVDSCSKSSTNEEDSQKTHWRWKILLIVKSFIYCCL